MKKELLKGFTMVTLLVAIAFAAAVVSANAQSPKLVIADIPFDFVVGDQTLAAGEYRMAPSSSFGNGLTIKSADTSNSVMRLTNSIEPRRNRTDARLVFHRYNNRYFLAEVWSGGDNVGRKLTRSRHERAIERELASIPSKSEFAQSTYAIVEIAAAVR